MPRALTATASWACHGQLQNRYGHVERASSLSAATIGFMLYAALPFCMYPACPFRTATCFVMLCESDLKHCVDQHGRVAGELLIEVV
jgi:hypothetical protein